MKGCFNNEKVQFRNNTCKAPVSGKRLTFHEAVTLCPKTSQLPSFPDPATRLP